MSVRTPSVYNKLRCLASDINFKQLHTGCPNAHGETSILLSVYCFLSFGRFVASLSLWWWNRTCVMECEGGKM